MYFVSFFIKQGSRFLTDSSINHDYNKRDGITPTAGNIQFNYSFYGNCLPETRVTPPALAVGSSQRFIPGYFNLCEVSASLASSSEVRTKFIAPAASCAWLTLVAPGMVTTISPLKWISQFRATWAMVAW